MLSNPRIELRQAVRAWRVARGRAGEPHVVHLAGGLGSVAAAAVVLAPGAHDRPLPFPGWDLPGVMTPGGAQALMKRSQVLPGRRTLVAGTGPFLLAVAALVVERGGEVAGVLEARGDVLAGWARHPRALAIGLATGKATEGARYLATLRRARVPVRAGWRVLAARPGPDGTLARADIAPRRRGAPVRTVAVDALAVGHGFTAALELAAGAGCALRIDPVDGAQVVVVDRDGRSSVAGIFVAGEATGVGGAPLARVEGELAGNAAAGGRARTSSHARRRAHGRFARALREVHAVDEAAWSAALPDATVACRCEEVTAGDVRHAIHELGADDLRSVKLLCRAGMGLCQGRMCAANVEAIAADALGRAVPDAGGLAARPFAAPVALGDLAALDVPDAPVAG